MATLTARPAEPASTRNDDFEPDEQWKTNLRALIEDNLSSMVADAKKTLEDKLNEAPVDAVTRDILTKEHMESMRNIRRIAQEQYTAVLERERQERRWAAGHQVEQGWSDMLMKEQQSILDNIKRDDGQNSRSQPRSNTADSLGSNRTGGLRWTPPTTTPAAEREDGYFSRASTRDSDTQGIGGGGGTADPPRHVAGAGLFSSPSTERLPGRWKAPMVDEPEEIEQPLPRHRSDSHSLRRANSIASKGIPEIWKPSISPEEDAVTSRTYANARRSSTASMTSSSYRASNISLVPERSADRTPEQSDTHASAAERERAKIEENEQQWSEINRARARETTGPSRADARQSAGSSHSQRMDERLGAPSPISPQSASPTRPVDIPRSMPPSANRSIHTKRSFTVDDPMRMQSSSPASRAWAGPSRSPTDLRYDRSPQTPEDYSRPWPPAHGLRSRLSTEGFRYGHPEGSSFAGEKQVFHEESEESDDDLADWQEQRTMEMQEQARIREAEARRKEEEVKRKEEEARRKEVEVRRKEEEARLIEQEARRKEVEARRKEMEALRKEEEAMRKEEEIKRMEEEARQMEETIRQKEEESRRREAEIKKREEEVKRREEELNRREAEARRKEADARRKDEEARRKEEEIRRKEEEKQKQQQEEFRRREEEIRRRADERKRQDSLNSDGGRAGSTYTSTSPPSSTSWPPHRGGTSGSTSSTASTDWNSSASSNRGSTASSTWSASSRTSANTTQSANTSSSRTSTPSGNTKPSSGTPRTAGSPPSAGGATNAPPLSESEWARRQAEQAKKQQEAFRKEQERLERERQARAGKILTKEEVIQLFEVHERQWSRVKTSEDLSWDSFPWPMLKRPSAPEDLTPAAISAYILSPHYPGDKTKPSKDRIKEHIRRWHPDRFETQILPKVEEDEREKVKEGAGSVARGLNELLTRSNVHDVFS